LTNPVRGPIKNGIRANFAVMDKAKAMKGRVGVFSAPERGTQGLEGPFAWNTLKTTLELDPKPWRRDKVTGARP